jgi:hypothetical protein
MGSTSARTCSVPVARMEALAEELRLLKASLAAMQGQLDGLLSELDVQSPDEQAGQAFQSLREAGPAAEQEPASGWAEQVQHPAELLAAVDDPPANAESEPILSADEPSDSHGPAISEPIAAAGEAPVIEDGVAETATIDSVPAAEEGAVTAVAEPAGAEPQAAPTTEATAEPPASVTVLAERRRTAPRVPRSGLRWAAAIALIAAIVAGVAAAGSGFAKREADLYLLAPEGSAFGQTAELSRPTIGEALRLRALSAF